MLEKITPKEKFSQFSETWSPRLVAELNGQHVRFVKIDGEFVWHHHEEEDELFFVIEGNFRMDFRDGSVRIEQGEFIVVPHGVEHRPVADDGEAHIMLFEPAGTVNTGSAGGDRTKAVEGI